MKCKTCRWWDVQWDRTEDGVLVGICQHKMVIQPSYGERNNRVMRADGVLTCDEGGGTGELMTGPDFGCIHYAFRNN